MTNPSEIKKLAYLRLKEAKVLFNNNLFDGAFYLAGYSVELMLKAKICERFDIPNLFDERTPTPIEGVGEIRKALKTHSFLTLLLVSGLRNKYDAHKATNIKLALNNAILMQWNESSRYLPEGTCTQKTARKMLDLLSGAGGILQWIESN